MKKKRLKKKIISKTTGSKNDDGIHPFDEKGSKFTEEGRIEYFLGVKIKQDGDSIKKLQQLPIERVLRVLWFYSINVILEPAPSIHMSHEDKDGIYRKGTWYYWSMICMLSYLSNEPRLEISTEVNRYARLWIDPKLSHENIKRVVKHLF